MTIKLLEVGEPAGRDNDLVSSTHGGLGILVRLLGGKPVLSTIISKDTDL